MTDKEAQDEVPGPVVWEYAVNGAHIYYSQIEPPEDAYDEGTLKPLYGPDLLAYADRMRAERDRVVNTHKGLMQRVEAERDADIHPCCQKWDTCMRRCAPLAENWRMAAKAAERERDDLRERVIEECAKVADEFNDPAPVRTIVRAIRAISEPQSRSQKGHAMKVTDEMVSRFMTWPLPESVCADYCATKVGTPGRTGTTLLNSEQARQVLEYVLAGPNAKEKE